MLRNSKAIETNCAGTYETINTEKEALQNIQDAIQEYLAAVKEMSRGQETHEIEIAA